MGSDGRLDVSHLMDTSLALTRNSPASKGQWRSGSVSDTRSEGWELESLWPHFSFRDAAVMHGFLLLNALLLPLPWQCYVTMACQRSHALYRMKAAA